MRKDLLSEAVVWTTMWLWGGFIYYCIELIWRGYSHPSMFVAGGICLIVLGIINNYLWWELPLAFQCVIGAVAITMIELIFGMIVNVWMGLNVWDYSDLPFNLFGQISLLFFVMWIPIALFGIYMFDFLRWKLLGDDKPHYPKIFRFK